jgi:hypothetical protein
MLYLPDSTLKVKIGASYACVQTFFHRIHITGQTKKVDTYRVPPVQIKKSWSKNIDTVWVLIWIIMNSKDRNRNTNLVLKYREPAFPGKKCTEKFLCKDWKFYGAWLSIKFNPMQSMSSSTNPSGFGLAGSLAKNAQNPAQKHLNNIIY